MKMAEFSLFQEALNEYERKTEYIKIEEKDDEFTYEEISNDKCTHAEISNDNGLITCVYCGEEIKKFISHSKDWRYYGSSDTKRHNNPTRVQIRRTEDRNIFKDVERMGFSDKIISIANQIYSEVTNGQIFRGNSRKAIIFACIFHAYKLDGRPQSHEKLITIFSLTRKNGLKGLKHVNLHSSRTSEIHTTYITAENLVNDIMDKFSANNKQKQEVVDLYKQIKNKSSILNRSRPQSVSAGLTYYWICKNNVNITIKEFAGKSELSEITINKIAKEISKILKTPHII